MLSPTGSDKLQRSEGNSKRLVVRILIGRSHFMYECETVRLCKVHRVAYADDAVNSFKVHYAVPP
jgi:hypothetical protein